MRERRKVYIVNKGVHDYSDAKRFGELVFLTEGSYNILSTSRMAREFTKQLRVIYPFFPFLLLSSVLPRCK